jgi:GAF domain-containing protein
LPLGEVVRLGEPVAAFGYPDRGTRHWDRAEGTIEQLDQEHPDPKWQLGPPLLKFKAAHIVRGFSGGPLLSLQSGAVIGIITTSIDTSRAAGGLAVPAHLLLTHADEIRGVQRSIRAVELRCPYPGLKSFDEAQEGAFFGRDLEIQQLADIVEAGERTVLLIGPSGCGKSSLVRAGLLPCFRRRDPATNAVTVTGASAAAVLEALLKDDSTRLERERPPPSPNSVLIVVDQFEELFTVVSAEGREAFRHHYGELRRRAGFTFVFTLRADYYGELLEDPLWDRSIRVVPLAPLRGGSLREAIERPAFNVGVTYDPRLLDRLVADAAVEPGALPLLQVVLERLWNRRRGRMIPLGAYVSDVDGGAKTGLAVAIERRANEVFSALTAEQVAVARRILLRLIAFTEGRPPTRRRQPTTALRSGAEDLRTFDATLEELTTRGRLLTVDRDLDGIEIVDLAHEALLTASRTLASWIDEYRATEQARRAYEAKAHEWLNKGAGESGLLDAAELSEIEKWTATAAANHVGVSQAVEDLIAASRVQRSNELRKERTMTALRGVALALGTTLDLDDLLELILAHALEILGAEYADLFLLDEAKSELVSRIIVGGKRNSVRVKVGRGIAGRVAETGNSRRVVDAHEDPDFEPEFDILSGRRTHALMGVPMRNHIGRTIGVLQVSSERPLNFTAADEELLTALATQAAVGIDNSRLVLTTIQKNRQLIDARSQLEMQQRAIGLTGKLNKRIQSARSLQEAMGFVIEAAMHICEGKAGAAFVRYGTLENGRIFIVEAHEKAVRNVENFGDIGVFGQAIEHQDVVFSERSPGHPHWTDAPQGLKLRAQLDRVIAAPLETGSEGITGAIAVYNDSEERPFGEHDIPLIRLVSGAAMTVLLRWRPSGLQDGVGSRARRGRR